MTRIIHRRPGNQKVQLARQVLAASVVGALTAAAAGFSPAAKADAKPSPVVIEIGNTAVTRARLDDRFHVAVRLLAHQQGVAFSEQNAATLARLRLQYLDKHANELVMLREAARRNVAASEEDVDGAIAQAFPTSRTMEAFLVDLKKNDVESKQLLRQIIEDEHTIRLLTEQLLDEISIPPGDVITLHHDIKENLATPASACVRQIQTETEELAREILAELRAGKAFEELAADPDLSNGFGDLGCFEEHHSGIGAEFEKAVFSADKGETIGPVMSRLGAHVVEVYHKESSRVPTLNEAYTEIERELALEKLPGKIALLVTASGVRTYPERFSAQLPAQPD